MLVTGASGLLGRAIKREFDSEGWNCVGTAFSRTGPGLVKVDLREKDSVDRLIEQHSPSIVIHSAAERRPDVVEKSTNDAERLNVSATQFLIDACSKKNIFLVYISTDYVFDGKNAPYKPSDTTNPLNTYGQLKLQGEAVVSKYANSGILRVPVLYGQVERLEESAVTVLMKGLQKHPEPVSMCNYQLRFPTHCDDVAMVVRQISEQHLSQPSFTGVWHWSGDECMTKYAMAKTMAEVLSLPGDNLVAVDHPPVGGTPRPYNTQLDSSHLAQMGFGKHTPFAKGIHQVLKGFVS